MWCFNVRMYTVSVWCFNVRRHTVSMWCFSVRMYTISMWCFSVRLYTVICDVLLWDVHCMWYFSVRMYTVSVWCFSVRMYSQCVVFQCQVGLVSSPDLMNMVKAYTTESNYTVWSDLLSDMSEMGRLLQYTDAATHFKNFVCDLLQAIYADLGWENMNPDEEGNSRLFIFMTANKRFLFSFLEVRYCLGITC